MTNEPIKFPVLVDAEHQSITVVSFRDLLTQISALEHIKQFQPMDWSNEDDDALQALETLKELCKINGCVESNPIN